MMVGATPDISKNDIQVNVQMRETAVVSLNITDADGTMVMEQKEKAQEGLSNYTIKGSSSLQPGEYFLKVVINGTDRMLVRLIKS
jgi:flagellar hook assembly protein FlgD